MKNSDFEFLMLSAGFEHGGNVTHRFFDGHPELYVYPFESQLGNRFVNDYLSSLERPQYRYPEFSTEGTPENDYELFYDEELKTLLRKPNGSKFRDADLKMDESVRKNIFIKFLSDKPRTRANIVKAFFIATFEAWTNYKRSGNNHIYVGYCPIIGIDSDKILHDFPDANIVHVVRNPYSAYCDTKKRPYPLSLTRYIMSWNIYHHIVLTHQQNYPDNITILKYEDLVENPKKALSGICAKLEIKFNDSMLYPSWNGKDISGNIYPWGTIKKATTHANIQAMKSLSDDEREQIRTNSSIICKVLGYDDFLNKK